jgi:hypothetical protein
MIEAQRKPQQDGATSAAPLSGQPARDPAGLLRSPPTRRVDSARHASPTWQACDLISYVHGVLVALSVRY